MYFLLNHTKSVIVQMVQYVTFKNMYVLFLRSSSRLVFILLIAFVIIYLVSRNQKRSTHLLVESVSEVRWLAKTFT